MNNEMTTTNSQLMTPASSQASLLEMRADPKKYPRVGAISREIAIAEMSRIISNAFLYRGQTADPTNIRFIASALVDELQGDQDNIGTGDISFAEVGRIIKRSILQDEMFGISVASLYKAIYAYIKGEGHLLQEKVDERKTQGAAQNTLIDTYARALVRRGKI